MLRKWLTGSTTMLLAALPVFAPAALALGGDDLAAPLQAVEEAKNGRPEALADALYDAGRSYYLVCDYKNAEDYFRRSLKVEQRLKRPDKLVSAMLQVGLALIYEGKQAESIEQLQATKQTAERLHVDAALPVIANNMAECYLQMGKVDEAEQLLESAVQGSGGASGKSKALQNLATLLSAHGKTKEAIVYAQQAVSLLASCDEGEQGLARCKLACLLDASGDHETAMKTYEQAAAEQLPAFADVVGEAELGIGVSLTRRLQIPSAIKHLERARQIAKDDGNMADVLLRAVTALGTCYADSEKIEEAQDCHNEVMQESANANPSDSYIDAGLQLAEDHLIGGNAEACLRTLQALRPKIALASSPSRYEALYQVALGKCYKQVGAFDAAVACLQSAVSTFHDLGYRTMEAEATNVLATIYLDYQAIDAFDNLQKNSADLYASIEEPGIKTRFDANNAQALLLENRYADAVPVLEKALAASDTTGDTGLQSAIDRNLGLAYLLSGEKEKALAAYRRALDLSKSSGSIETQWSCNLGVGKVLKEMGDYQAARPYLEAAVELVEKERSMLTRDSFKTHNLDFRRDCFLELVDLDARTNRPQQALVVAERGKARAFLDMLANREGRRLVAVRSAGNGGTRNSKPDPKPLMVASVPQEGLRSVNVVPSAQPDVDITALSPVSATPPSQEELTDLVRKRGSTCVEYLRIGDRICLWVIKPDGSAAMLPAVEKANLLQALVDDFTANITASATDRQAIVARNRQRQTSLHKLYEAIWKPVEPFLPGDQQSVVTVIPDGFLFAVPFAALVDDGGNFVIEKHTISYAPALGVLRATQKLQEETAELPHKLLAFGNPITKAQQAILAPLPFTEKEVNQIAALYGPERSTVRIGAQANKEAFRALLAGATDIHLATHGLVDQVHPMRSALVLAPEGADDGWLTVADIMTLNNLKAKLVVLSACETGKGQISGDGVVGLSRAFVIAGTPSVLVSQWNVDDAMTEFQMSRFYRSYLQGTDKAKSLREAQLATIRFMENAPDGKAPAHSLSVPRPNPRFWAAFQLIGEYR